MAKNKNYRLLLTFLFIGLVGCYHLTYLAGDTEDEIETSITNISNQNTQNIEIKTKCHDLLQKIKTIKDQVKSISQEQENKINSLLRDSAFTTFLDKIPFLQNNSKEQTTKNLLTEINRSITNIQNNKSSISSNILILKETITFKILKEKWQEIINNINNYLQTINDMSTENDKITEANSKFEDGDFSKLKVPFDEIKDLLKIPHTNTKILDDIVNIETEFQNLEKETFQPTPLQNTDSSKNNTFIFWILGLFILIIVIIFYFLKSLNS